MNTFYLPESIGFTETRVELIYNTGEIESSYLDETAGFSMYKERVSKFFAIDIL